MAKPSAGQPDLTKIINDLSNRIASLERAPSPVAFQRMPSADPEIITRWPWIGNTWVSIGIIPASGIEYDRIAIEHYFRVFDPANVAEFRLVAFEYWMSSNGTGMNRTKRARKATATRMVSASSGGYVSLLHWEWLHGLPLGFNAPQGTEDDPMYTIELQIRYNKEPAQMKNREQIAGWIQREDAPKQIQPVAVDGGWALVTYGESSQLASHGWRYIDGLDTSDINIGASNIYLATAFPQESLPRATDEASIWIWSGDFIGKRAPDVYECSAYSSTYDGVDCRTASWDGSRTFMGRSAAMAATTTDDITNPDEIAVPLSDDAPPPRYDQVPAEFVTDGRSGGFVVKDEEME